jgi:very-short-patch-repair endonuclease
MGSRRDSDEWYLITICNQVLGLEASRQHRFDGLRGDPGKNGRRQKLPVDAFYAPLRLIVEVHERQHTVSVPLFDRRSTISGPRREQRAKYDKFRREFCEKEGYKLVVLDTALFKQRRKKLVRDQTSDHEVVRAKLRAADVTRRA